MNVRHRSLVAAGVACGLLVTAACGSSGKSSASSAGSSKTTVAENSGGSFTLDAPLKIVGTWEVAGESPNAIATLQDGAQMAVDEINAAGGVGGKPISFERVSTSATDPVKAATSVRLAVTKKPSAIIGVASEAPALAAAPLAEQAGIPTIAITNSDKVRTDGANGNKWMFLTRPTSTSAPKIAADFATDGLHAKKVGVLNVNLDYGTSAFKVLGDEIKAKGASVSAHQEYTFNAADLTQQVLAMKGADAVINWAYPNPLGVQLNQFQQNGIDIPTIDAAAAGITVNGGLAKGAAIDKLYAVQDCNPANSDDARVKDWAAKFKAKFSTDPDYDGAEAYDAVQLVAAAAKAARSADPSAIRDQLEKVHFQGMCSSDYHSDTRHTLNHNTVIVSYKGGTPATVKSYTLDDNQ